MKLETNNRRKSGKFMNTWQLNSTLQRTTPVTNRSNKKFKNGNKKSIWRQMKMETQHTKTYEMQQEQF